MSETSTVLPPLRRLAAVILWPLLLLTCIALYAQAIEGPHRGLAFNAIYLSLALSLFLLERWLPFEPTWLHDDGQMPADLAHTLLSKGVVQALVLMGAVIGVGGDVAPGRYWPTTWPVAAQVVAGLILIEFGLYWAHRLAHRWHLLWRFHAVHHSVKRLWFFNTGRFHLVDSMKSLAFGLPVLWLVGAPGLVIIWVSATTAFIGILTHVNIDVRCGPLNYVFNTPQLHRWHHSMKPEEGDRNFGENLVLWDQIFGTWINPDRRPPREIGIREPMPAHFGGQFLQPFRLAPWRLVPATDANASAQLPLP